jgi:hypothetical protein
MKYTITTTKEYRLFVLTGFGSSSLNIQGSSVKNVIGFGSSSLNIQGSSVKNVIDSLLLEIENQNTYAELGPSVTFALAEYEVGEIPCSTYSWMPGEPSISSFKPVYFNQKFVEDPKNPGQLLDPNELIKKHKGYKNMVRLWKEVEKEAQRKVIESQKENIRIKKENDILLLASIIKRNKDFKKMLKDASNLKTPEDLQLIFH